MLVCKSDDLGAIFLAGLTFLGCLLPLRDYITNLFKRKERKKSSTSIGANESKWQNTAALA